jgi:hypothetical protein
MELVRRKMIKIIVCPKVRDNKIYGAEKIIMLFGIVIMRKTIIVPQFMWDNEGDFFFDII